MSNKMILILFFCLKLSILHFCSSQRGYKCELDKNDGNPAIFLIDENTNFFQSKLNSKFFSVCDKYYNITMGSLEESKQFKNVIQFAVKDYYDEKPINNFVYAGNITKTDYAVCKTKYDCSEIANLVSQSLKDIDGGNIYDFVQNMNLTKRDNQWDDINNGHIHDVLITHRKSCKAHFENIADLSIVLFCYKSAGDSSLKKVNIRPLTLLQIPNDECQNYLNVTRKISSGPRVNFDRLLAILAPEPVEVPFEYQFPTIFYEAPYIFSEDKTAFPNSMTLLPWRLLKYGFLKFIQKFGWQRVAIVTDDAEYSIEFEDELTTLFRKEGLAYTVIRCEDAKCDMRKVLHELRRVLAKIVVANVEKNNAEYLLLNSNDDFEWLVRDLSGKLHTKNAGATFIFSLHSTQHMGCHNVDDNVLTGLSSITQAYHTTLKETNEIKKREFYRRFAKKLEEITPRITEAIIKVHYKRKLLKPKLITIMSVNENGAEIKSHSDPYKSPPTDGTAHCLVSTYDFYESCQDHLLMFFMFSLMMFVLTCLVITCYFDKTAPLNDIRYQNF